jgi:hypothetical protein
MFRNNGNIMYWGKSIFLLFGAYSVLVFGCKVLPPADARIKQYKGMEIYDGILSRNHGIKTYSAGRVLINIVDDDQVINMRGAVRIDRDSVIMISVSAFAGIEVARIKLTNDSVRIIDRINNIYFAGSYEDSGRFLPLPVSFNFVQGFFFASAINFIDEFEDMSEDERIYNFENELLTVQIKTNFFSGVKKNYDLARISLDPDFMVHNIDLLSGDQKMYVSLNYGSYNVYDGFSLPESIEMYYLSHNLPLKATLRIGRIELNRDLTFPFSVPERYKKIEN